MTNSNLHANIFNSSAYLFLVVSSNLHDMPSKYVIAFLIHYMSSLRASLICIGAYPIIWLYYSPERLRCQQKLCISFFFHCWNNYTQSSQTLWFSHWDRRNMYYKLSIGHLGFTLYWICIGSLQFFRKCKYLFWTYGTWRHFLLMLFTDMFQWVCPSFYWLKLLCASSVLFNGKENIRLLN